jgi:hypothetical protein
MTALSITRRAFRTVRATAIIALGLAAASPASQAQFRLTAGVKAWYTTWNIPVQQTPGIAMTDMSPALLAGPYLNFRFGKVSATFMYSTSLVTYEMTEKSDGTQSVLAYEGHMHLDRQDINVFLNYSIAPEVTLFANLKLLSYSNREALATILDRHYLYRKDYRGTGFGLGAQFTVPFSGESPLYTFLSAGAYANDSKRTSFTLSIDEGAAMDVTDMPSEDGSELLYFLDAGLGMRIPASHVGAAIGLRVENGSVTKTAIGPTANLFYTF